MFLIFCVCSKCSKISITNPPEKQILFPSMQKLKLDLNADRCVQKLIAQGLAEDRKRKTKEKNKSGEASKPKRKPAPTSQRPPIRRPPIRRPSIRRPPIRRPEIRRPKLPNVRTSAAALLNRRFNTRNKRQADIGGNTLFNLFLKRLTAKQVSKLAVYASV